MERSAVFCFKQKNDLIKTSSRNSIGNACGSALGRSERKQGSQHFHWLRSMIERKITEPVPCTSELKQNESLASGLYD